MAMINVVARKKLHSRLIPIAPHDQECAGSSAVWPIMRLKAKAFNQASDGSERREWVVLGQKSVLP
jgi:hypothetical protein